MSEEKTIKHFTAADIEKYWQGKMPATEMHALEKAAMDDPFLADALEGYKNTASPSGDIDLLKARLAERTDTVAKAAKLTGSQLWWRVAAMVILMAGAGYAAVRLFPNTKQEELAGNAVQKNKSPEAQTQVTDSVIITDTLLNGSVTKTAADKKNNPVNESLSTKDTSIISDAIVAAEESNFLKNQENSLQYKPTASATDKKPDTLAASGNVTKADDKLAERALEKKKDDDNNVTEGLLSERVASKNQTNAGKKTKVKPLNFSGRVLDNDNNPVAYANVFNLSNEKTTLAGVDGYFSIPVEEDSLVLLDVRSQGYVSREFRLNRFDKRNNVLVLYPEVADEDAEPGEITVYAELYDPLMLKNEKQEFPEPEHGWVLFNQYLANNLTKSKESLTTGTVVLNISLNKTGRPSQIQVVKSLRKECDNEAIRLIREGPRWIVRGKSNEVIVSVHFR